MTAEIRGLTGLAGTIITWFGGAKGVVTADNNGDYRFLVEVPGDLDELQIVRIGISAATGGRGSFDPATQYLEVTMAGTPYRVDFHYKV